MTLCCQKKWARNCGSAQYMATYHGTFTAMTMAKNATYQYQRTDAGRAGGVSPLLLARTGGSRPPLANDAYTHSGTNNSTSEIGPFVRNPSPDATAAATHQRTRNCPVRTASKPHITDTLT